KPIPPINYGGRADYCEFSRFAKIGIAYVEDAQFPHKRCNFKLSTFLIGTARDCYIQKIKEHEETMSLHEFFQILFDYCFPANYCLGLRNKLDQMIQKDKTVARYAHKIQ
ncbi:hypothetical protein CPB83DRAFT_748557, partial [Crepidotus variabilis]